MGKGKRYELALTNDICGKSTAIVTALRPDFSGNSKFAVADVVILWQPPQQNNVAHAAYVEVKKRSGGAGQRTIVASGSSDGQTGREELTTLIEETPAFATPWFAVKFDHRELLVVDAQAFLDQLDAGDEDGPFAPRLTDAGSISMVKPELHEWNSSAASDPDWRVLAESVGVPSYLL